MRPIISTIPDDLLSRFRDLATLASLIAEGEEVYIVGGALRDLFLGRPVADLDIAAAADPTPLARALARRIGGHWFFLDEQRRQSRVTVRDGEGVRTFDFAPFRASTLEADLRLRDFTINAMALALRSSGPGELLDPLGARHDLANGRLKEASPGVFEDDPLRVLKGVRHAVTLDFDVEKGTASHMCSAAPLLEQVAPERVRAELGAIFSASPIASALELMRFLDLVPPLFGPPVAGGWEEGIRQAVRCETLLKHLACEPSEKRLLSDDIEAGFFRLPLLKFAAFARGYSGKEGEEWGERFKLSRRSTAILKSLLAFAPQPNEDIDSIPPGRPRALWAAGLGRHPIEALIFHTLLRQREEASAADAVRPFLRDFLRYSENGRVPDLVDGDWVRTQLPFPTGPAVGKALTALRQEEIAGSVRTTEEGRKFVESFAKKWIDNP